MEFTEQTPIETGFSDVFQRRIVPELDRLETERQDLLRTARRHAAIPLGVAGAIALVILFTSDDLGGGLFGAAVFLVIGGLVALFLWKRQARRWGGSVSGAIMPAVCDFLGDLTYDQAARNRFPIDRIQGLGMIGSHNRARLEDRLEGRYRDTDFELVEAHLQSKSTDSDGDSRTKTVFDGLLFRIGVPEPVPTDILIARDYGMGNKLFELFASSTGRGMPKVPFDHDAFEQAFEVYADDPDAARATMPPGFLDNLLDIARSEGDRGAKGMTAAFQADSFYLALWRKGDFLKMGALTTPVGDMEPELHAVFDDLVLVRRIIDRLHGDAPDA